MGRVLHDDRTMPRHLHGSPSHTLPMRRRGPCRSPGPVAWAVGTAALLARDALAHGVLWLLGAALRRPLVAVFAVALALGAATYVRS